ncbi:hypothetical protein BGW80DRAFT_1231820, partial [Lactifluus volemus]
MDDLESQLDPDIAMASPRPNTDRPFRTEPDRFGVFREYAHGQPSITPDQFHSLSDISDSPYLALDPFSNSHHPRHTTFGSDPQKITFNIDSDNWQQSHARADAARTPNLPAFAPFRNASVYRLMTWFHRPSNTKSIGELNSLVHDVLLAPDFQTNDLVGFDAVKENTLMDHYHENISADHIPSPFSFDDTWIKSTIEIPVPCDGVRHSSEAEAPKFQVDIHHRRLTEVIKSAYLEPAAKAFHTFPFRAFWKPSADEPAERIYSEAYTGNKWICEYESILKSPRSQDDPHSHLERFLVGLMIWSDSTSLAQFGTAELWPIYLYIGAQSKYSRVKPSSFAAHHIAYLPK